MKWYILLTPNSSLLTRIVVQWETMKTQAAKMRREGLFVVALTLVLSAILIPQSALATRSIPESIGTVSMSFQARLEASRKTERPEESFHLLGDDELLSLAAFAAEDAEEIERINAQMRFRVFSLSDGETHPSGGLWGQKTASGGQTSLAGSNVWETRGLTPVCRRSVFQGAWTDPVTGIAYHRNRWYDPRTANWLSEDPAGAVDSPNLYAFVGWGPHVNIDPMGNVVPKNAVIDPDHWMYRYGDKFYQHTITGMVVELDLPRSDAHHRVDDPEVIHAIYQLSGKKPSGMGALQKFYARLYEDTRATNDVMWLYWGIAAAPFVGGEEVLAHVIGGVNLFWTLNNRSGKLDNQPGWGQRVALSYLLPAAGVRLANEGLFSKLSSTKSRVLWGTTVDLIYQKKTSGRIDIVRTVSGVLFNAWFGAIGEGLVNQKVGDIIGAGVQGYIEWLFSIDKPDKGKPGDNDGRSSSRPK